MGGFTHQPSGPARIDWSNPLSAGLQSASYATESLRFRNFVTGATWDDPYTEHSFRIREYSKHGISRATPGGSYRQWLTLTPTSNRGKATLLVLVRPRAASATVTAIADCGEALGGWAMAVFKYNTAGRFTGNCVNGAVLTADAPYTPGELYALAFTNNGSAARQRFYINGAVQAATGSYGGNASKKLDTCGVGNNGGNSTDFFAMFSWDRELTAAEIREVSANPYQLFVASEDYYDLAPVSQPLPNDTSLAATALSASYFSAVLTTGKPLGATALSASYFSAALTTEKPLAASASSASYFSAVLKTSIQLGAAAVSTSYAAGNLATSIRLGASAYSASTASADLLAVAAQSFSPSVARTLQVLPAPGAFAGTDYWSWEIPKRPAALKRADQALDYSFNWGPWLAEIGAGAAGYQFIVPADLTVLADKRSGAVCSIFAAGGNVGLRPITCRITTDTVPPLVEDRTIYINVTN